MLILDEPTAVLTGDETQRLFLVLRQLAGSGTAVLLISHKLGEVFDISSRITILRQGKAAGSTRPGEMSVRQVAQLMISGVENETSDNVGVRPPGGRLPGGRLPGEWLPGEWLPGGRLPGERLPGGRLFGVQPPDAELNSVGRPVKGADATFEDAPAALEIRDLYAVGPDGRSAVNGVSLAVDRGQIYGVAGVDGNGQSTLAAAVMGLIPKLDKASWERLKAWPGGRLRIGKGASDLRGILFIYGEDLTCASPETLLEKPFGYIPEDCQETGIVSEMTLEENLILNSFSREKYGRGPFMDWGNVRREAVRAMCDMDIRAFSGKQTAGTLSGGNQQKLVVARELGKRPEILLAVNPTRGIDANAAQKICSLFLQARADGCAILLISTDLDEILYLSDRIGVMYEGRLAAEFDGLLSAPKAGDMSGVEESAAENEESAAENKESAAENKESAAENKESAVKNRGILREQLLRRQIGLAMAGHSLQDAGGNAV